MWTKNVEETLDWQERKESVSSGLVGIVNQRLKVTYSLFGIPVYIKKLDSKNIGDYSIKDVDTKKVGF